MTDDLTRLLDELEAAHGKATPGPWRWDARQPGTIRDDHPRLPAALVTFRDPGADAALIVAAVNALPALIAELRRRDEALAGVRGLHHAAELTAGDVLWCEACGLAWPCPTDRVLAAHEQAEEAR